MKKKKKKKKFNTGKFENYVCSEGRWAGTTKSTCLYMEGAFLKLKTSSRYVISYFLQMIVAEK